MAKGSQQEDAKAISAVVSLIQSCVKDEEKLSPLKHIHAYFYCGKYDYNYDMFLSFQTSPEEMTMYFA